MQAKAYPWLLRRACMGRCVRVCLLGMTAMLMALSGAANAAPQYHIPEYQITQGER